MFTTLISSTELQTLRESSARPVILLDCTFDLADPAAGRHAYHQEHLPGAFYVHLDNELSGAKSGHNGRHPLPDPDAFTDRMRALGVNGDTQVVCYDAQGGMFAARAWWLLRWIGHEAVAVLDGGKPAWIAAALPVEDGATPEPETPGNLTRRPALVDTVDAQAVASHLGRAERLVVDARAPDRYRGENETLDPVGGHIPGAVNRFFKGNLDTDGRFKPRARLQAEWRQALNGTPPERAIMQCGSGVTACHNLLALEAAGLRGAALYPGSWSEWCADPRRPVATGETP